MLLQREINPELNTVTAYGDDYLVINQDRFETAVCFAPQGPVRGLDLRRPEEISSGFLEDLLGIQSASQDPMAFLEGATGPSLPADAPEVLLIGTGSTQVFLATEITRPLLALGVGVETMTTHAAARTYNILMSEERRVLALLLPGDPTHDNA